MVNVCYEYFKKIYESLLWLYITYKNLSIINVKKLYERKREREKDPKTKDL